MKKSQLMKTEIPVQKAKRLKDLPKDDALGFGKYFSDHMFAVNYSTDKNWFDSRITPYQKLELDPGASVLHYGQAIFEGMKAFHGVDGKVRLFRPERNWLRMNASAERLCMQMVDLETFSDGIMALVSTDRRWIPTKPGTALYLRPTLIGSEAFLGVRPSEEFVFYVIACPVGGYYSEKAPTVKIWVEREYSRAAPGGIGFTKAGGNYASSLAGALRAKNLGYSQVLWLDSSQKKYVEEVGTMNVFFLIGDTLVTPNLSGTILPGVTRESVIQLMQHWGRRVEERPIELAEVVEAHRKGQLKEVFGTGTAASISPVGVLGMDDVVLTINDAKVGPLSNELSKTLNGIQYGSLKDELDWTVEVPMPPERASRGTRVPQLSL